MPITCLFRFDSCCFQITYQFWFDSCCFQDSLILGQVHLAFLRLLLADVEIQLNKGFIHQASRSCNFLGLVHSVSVHAFRSIFQFNRLLHISIGLSLQEAAVRQFMYCNLYVFAIRLVLPGTSNWIWLIYFIIITLLQRRLHYLGRAIEKIEDKGEKTMMLQGMKTESGRNLKYVKM